MEHSHLIEIRFMIVECRYQYLYQKQQFYKYLYKVPEYRYR